MITCAKPKLMSYFSEAIGQERFGITEDLTLVKSRSLSRDSDSLEEYYSQVGAVDPAKKRFLRTIDDFLASHQLEAKLPEAIASSGIVPRSLSSESRSISLPLTEAPKEEGWLSFKVQFLFFCCHKISEKLYKPVNSSTGRSGLMKKVIIPFLLGLKFKATALVPLAFALIALKTWKALTLGLLSLVLSGAMLIYKFTKPKVAYEVLHYGHPPVVENPPHWDTSAHGPYRAYRK